MEVQKQETANGFRMAGTIKFWIVTKGYGFVIPDDGGTDIMVHRSCLEEVGCVCVLPGYHVDLLYRCRDGGRRYATKVLEIRPSRVCNGQ